MIAERIFLEDRKAGLRVVDDQDELPRLVGAMMGAANDVSEHLADVSYPAHVTTFLRKFERLSWGQAGNYRKHKYERPGAWCFFTLAKWATITKLDKYQLAHIRQRVTGDGICFYQPNTTGERDLDGDVADGRLIWNLAFSEWKPLQLGYTPPKRGGKRPGAGRPKKQQPAIADLNTEQGTIANIDSHSQDTPLQARDKAENATTPPIPGADPGYTQNQTLQCSPALNYSVVTMDASHEARGGMAPEGSVIKSNYEEKETLITPPSAAYQEELLSVPVVEKPKRTRKPDLLWDKAVELFGHAPKGGEVWNWRKYVKQMREDAITPEQLQQATERYRQKWPTIDCTFKAVFNNLGDLLKPSQSVPIPALAAAYQFAPAIPAYMQPSKGGQ